MFLFKKKSATNDAQFEYSLHTGDFRAAKEMLAYPQLQSLCISQLFLDTTYVCIYCMIQMQYHLYTASVFVILSLSFVFIIKF